MVASTTQAGTIQWAWHNWNIKGKLTFYGSGSCLLSLHTHRHPRVHHFIALGSWDLRWSQGCNRMLGYVPRSLFLIPVCFSYPDDWKSKALLPLGPLLIWPTALLGRSPHFPPFGPWQHSRRKYGFQIKWNPSLAT